MLKYILFDLDNTLYPKSSGLDKEVNRRMTEFTAAYLQIPAEEAQKLRETEAIPFGTTLKWLVGSHRLDAAGVERFLKEVHPEDLNPFFPQNPQLRRMLEELSFPMAILTNSHQEHTGRVLRQLGIIDLFPLIFDIRYNNFLGKPNPETYKKVLSQLNMKAHEVLFIDDMPRYLYPFRDLGGQVLLIDEYGLNGESGLRSLRTITELKNYLDKLQEG